VPARQGRTRAPPRSLSPVFDGRCGVISSGSMGHPYRFVGGLTLLALVWATFDALTRLALGIAITANVEPKLGERMFIGFVVQGLSRYGTFVPGVALALFPPACILGWIVVDRWCKQPAWLDRSRAVLIGWLVAIPTAAIAPVAAFKLMEWLSRYDSTVIGQLLGLGAATWCAGAACYVALAIQRRRERAAQSRVSATWLAVAALLTTLGPIQVAWIGGVAIPLWVLWRSGLRTHGVAERTA
jgi:hypothetical protein